MSIIVRVSISETDLNSCTIKFALLLKHNLKLRQRHGISRHIKPPFLYLPSMSVAIQRTFFSICEDYTIRLLFSLFQDIERAQDIAEDLEGVCQGLQEILSIVEFFTRIRGFLYQDLVMNTACNNMVRHII